MKKSRLAVSLMTAMASGAWMTLGGMVWASGPGPQPPDSLGAVYRAHPAPQTPAPCPEIADHFDTGPCWEEESALAGDCPWRDDCDYGDDYAYDYEEDNWDHGVGSKAEGYRYREVYGGTDESGYEDEYGWEGEYGNSEECVYKAREQAFDGEVSYDDDCYWDEYWGNVNYDDNSEDEDWAGGYGCDLTSRPDDSHPDSALEEWSHDCYEEEGQAWDAYDSQYDECFGYYDDCVAEEETGPDYAEYDSDGYDYDSYDYDSYDYDSYDYPWYEYGEYGYNEYDDDEPSYSEYGFDDYGDDGYGQTEYGYDEYGRGEHGYDAYWPECDGYEQDYPEEAYTYDDWDSCEDDCEFGNEYEYAWPEEAYGYPEMRHGSYDYDVSDGYYDYDDYDAWDEDACDESAYGGYCDAYPYEEFAYPEGSAEEAGGCFVDVAVEDSARSGGASSPGICGRLEMFAWHPAELLLFADQEVLRTLQGLGGESSAVRRATLNEYLEGLGWEAIDFAFRLEDVTGMEVLGLADDLPSAAAFLACYRLIERGDLGMDEGVEVLRRTLEDLSLDWIEGVDEITSDVREDWTRQQWAGRGNGPARQIDLARLSEPLLEAVVNVATRKLGGLGGTILALTVRLSELGWEPELPGPTASQAAAAAGGLHR